MRFDFKQFLEAIVVSVEKLIDVRIAGQNNFEVDWNRLGTNGAGAEHSI